jgi:hypothetical protein
MDPASKKANENSPPIRPLSTTQGKTSFIRRFLGKPLAGLEYVPTVGIDVVVHPYGGPGAPVREGAPVRRSGSG